MPCYWFKTVRGYGTPQYMAIDELTLNAAYEKAKRFSDPGSVVSVVDVKSVPETVRSEHAYYDGERAHWHGAGS